MLFRGMFYGLLISIPIWIGIGCAAHEVYKMKSVVKCDKVKQFGNLKMEQRGNDVTFTVN